MTMKTRSASLLCAAALFAGLSVHAADPVTEAIDQAYAPYRVALFRTNSKAQAESEQAIAQAQQAWQSIIDRYAARPTVPYERDNGFADTLRAVAGIYAQAAAEIQARQLPEAHETLETARDLMADLRRRNGVITFSDHMNAYHAEMEHLLMQGEALAAGPQGMLNLAERVGVLAYLAGKLRSEAPAQRLQDAEFSAALQALEASVTALRKAVSSQDARAVREALGRLKGPYSRMFLKFG